jgi:hypothetical protein
LIAGTISLKAGVKTGAIMLTGPREEEEEEEEERRRRRRRRKNKKVLMAKNLL